MRILRTPIGRLGAALYLGISKWWHGKGAAQHGVDGGLIGHRKAIAGLKALNKSRDKMIFSKTLPEEYAEQFRYPGESDRSIIILNGSMLEDRLETTLHANSLGLNADERARLFGFDGPLGTFSSKIRMAHAFGMIDRGLAKEIDLVREMRNTAAHTLSPITFDTPEIRAAVMCFLSPEQAEKAAVWDKMDVRTMFLMLCTRIDVRIWSTDWIWSVDYLFEGVDALRRGEKPPPFPFSLRTWLSKWL